MTRVKGFTLIELMVVVALIAIIATVAVPSFTDFIRKNEVQAKADEITRLLQFARSQAVSSRSPVIVKQNTASSRWSVISRDAETRVLDYVPAKVSFSSDMSNNQLSFNAYGAASNSVKISICHGKNHKNGYLLEIKRSGGIKLSGRGDAPEDCKV